MQQKVCVASCGNESYARAITSWAKMELLKEKVKQRMDQRYGKQLDKVADLLVEVVSERAKGVKEIEAREEELQNAFEELGEEKE